MGETEIDVGVPGTGVGQGKRQGDKPTVTSGSFDHKPPVLGLCGGSRSGKKDPASETALAIKLYESLTLVFPRRTNGPEKRRERPHAEIPAPPERAPETSSEDAQAQGAPARMSWPGC
jgi:hypothetical protein